MEGVWGVGGCHFRVEGGEGGWAELMPIEAGLAADRLGRWTLES